jgi:hypothetical protein
VPKSRHRAPSACLRQWVVWAVAGLVVATAIAFVSPLGGGFVPVAGTFLLLLLCFTAGSLANSMFLSRPLRQGGHIVLPAVQEPDAIERISVESERTRHPPRPVAGSPRAARTPAEVPAFASSSDIGGNLEVTVLISGNVASDPAGSEAGGTDRADLSDVYVVDSIPVQKTCQDMAEIEPETAARTEESGPYPGSVLAKSNGQSPDGSYRIKGNTRSKRYHTMQSPYYERTKATVWFRSTADAERAGFSAWNSRVNNAS